MGIEKLLGKIYYNPKEGFMGVNNLFKKAKAKDKTVKLVDVKKWLKKQAVSQVHTRRSEKIEYLPIFSFNPGHYQMDLTDMNVFKSQNKNFRYILTIININTRKLYAYKTKSKSPVTITKLLKKFVYDVENFHKNDKQRPSPYIRNITTDAGSEFKGSARDYLNSQNIELQVVYPGDKLWTTSKIERVHRTLKELFQKWFTYTGKTVWYDMLDTFIENYNNRYHRVIKMAPNEVDWIAEKYIIKEDIVRMIKKVNKLQFWLGDLVRIKQKKSIFEKGESLYSDNVYKVVKIKALGTMKLEDKNGKLLKRTFKDYQLLYVGRSMTEIEGKASRGQIAAARKKARTKRRLGQEGVSRQNIIRESKRIGDVMRPRRKKKVKKLNWKYKRNDKVEARARFFRGTELSYKVREGIVKQTNSKYQGNIPAYNIKWNDQDVGIWYDKESVEDKNNVDVKK